jgi:hypothetical protein
MRNWDISRRAPRLQEVGLSTDLDSLAVDINATALILTLQQTPCITVQESATRPELILKHFATCSI